MDGDTKGEADSLALLILELSARFGLSHSQREK